MTLSKNAFLLWLNLLLIAGALVALAVNPSAGSSALIVIANPFGSQANAAAIVAHANGALLRGGRSPAAVLADNGDPGFIRRLYASGAILVLDAGGARGCGAYFF